MFLKVLKKCKTKEELLAKVAPYLGKDRGLDRLIFRLEGFDKSDFKGLRKEIITALNHSFSLQGFEKIF